MLERAVFLDRDNTIIENDGYLGDPSRVKLLPGAATALAAMRQLGYRLIVVSNQSGVARGMFDEAAVEAVNAEMSRQLQEQGSAYIDASYYCPYHPDAPLPEYRVDHDWRKPKCGMLKQAATDFRLDLAQSWMIGDQNRDIGAGAAAGCRTILLKDPDRSAAVETDLGRTVSPSFVVRTLADAARIIAREGRNPPPTPLPPSPSAPAAPAPVQPLAPAAQRAAVGGAGGEGGATGGAVERLEVTSPAAGPAADAGNSASSAVKGAKARVESPASGVLNEEMREKAGARPVTGAPVVGSSKTERLLEELVVQLRQQNRHAELHPEFSRSDMAALILQILAATALVLGVVKFVNAPVTFTNNFWPEYFLGQFARQDALIWGVIAMVLQGMVLALVVRKRRKP